MAIAQVTAGNRITTSDLNAYYNLLKGAAGESVTLIYNAAGAVIIQPSSDPAANTEAIQIKNNAGTVQSALTFDGKLKGAAVYIASQPVVTQYAAGNSSTALTIDWNNGDTQTVTMTGNCTFTFSNPISGRFYALRLAQDATGSRTATWPATVKWPANTAPTLTTTASHVDVVTFYWDGTNYLGTSTLNYTVP